jgi:threonine dehydrogenase-like Zn-dependent dehydrogenase
LSIPELARALQAGPERREVALREVALGQAPSPGHSLVRNGMTLIDSGYDLALLERSAAEGRWLTLGRLALGQVAHGAADGGPAEGEWVYWRGPHADFAWLDGERELWIPAPSVDPLLMPAGIGAEAQWGVDRAVQALGDLPTESIVLGQGMLGHLAAQWLKHRGSAVTVVENSPKRLEFSRKAGLKRKVDTHNADWMDQLRKWHPRGVKLLMDATGAPAAIESLLPILSDGAVLGLLGPWRTRPLTGATERRIAGLSGKIVGPSPWLGEAPEHRALVEAWLGLIRRGEIPTERLLTHHIGPEEAPMAVKRFAAGIRSWQGCVIHWERTPTPDSIGDEP